MLSFLKVLQAFLPALASTANGLGSTATNVTDQVKLFQQASTQPSWQGQSSDAQQSRMSTYVDMGGKFAAALLRSQAQTAAGTAQMQAGQMTVQAAVNVAKGAGFLVMPNGTVRLSPAQRAATADKPAARFALQKVAWKLTAVIHAGMTQSTAADAQTAAALIEVATQYLAQLFQKESEGSASLPPVEIPPATPVTTTPVEVPEPTPLPAFDGGAGLSGVDASGGIGGGLEGAGGGAFGGAAGLGAGAAGTLGGTLGADAMGAGTAGGAAGGAGAAGARGGAVGAPFMPMGAGGAAGRDSERAGRDGWLQEDDDPWRHGDAPDGVLS
ncbi:hypothetical protein Val02_58880 [Virgisporangium aliadipatigenens]|uniref:Uncharacterized protein n=1 Tax=Virgisporangium aliadipatigenens TaxID=741659 RepID=A0A8J4DUB2_9ACTN|nr:hypothetical protein [Virgisporangium aliadipatigenens]GIJ49002.1 hypothetical protein Val02_58880 [Virgisporangium aliadipatigenens]